MGKNTVSVFNMQRLISFIFCNKTFHKLIKKNERPLLFIKRPFEVKIKLFSEQGGV